MRRKRVPTSWFRRFTSPVREFIRADIDMTQQALRRAHPATVNVMCAPSLFLLWVLDETDAMIADLRGLFRARRPSSPPDVAE